MEAIYLSLLMTLSVTLATSFCRDHPIFLIRFEHGLVLAYLDATRHTSVAFYGLVTVGIIESNRLNGHHR